MSMREDFERAELVRDALNDAGYEQARRITENQALAVYWAVAAERERGRQEAQRVLG